MLWLIYALAAAVIWGVNYAVSGRLLEKGLSPQALFFIDLIGHQNDPKVEDALRELVKHTSICEVLGSYPRAEQALNE